MVKKNEMPRVRYEPPKAELLQLSQPLTFMGHFSRNAQFDDWSTEDAFWELEDEENWGADDWGGQGSAGNDTTW